MRFVVPGTPKGKARPRVCFKGNRAWAYTPKVTRTYESEIKKHALKSGIKKKVGNVSIEISAIFKIPKSTSKTKSKQMLEGQIRPTKKPDMDNIAKTVLDALNGIAYDDDKQVCTLKISRWYGMEEKLIIDIKSEKNEEFLHT